MAGRIPSDNLTETEAAERAELIGDLSYRVELALGDDPAAPTFRSSARVGFSCRRAGAETFLNLTVGEPGRLREVLVDGRPSEAAVEGYDGARIPLAGLPAGPIAVEVVADCAYERVGVGLHRVVDPADQQVYLYTHFEPFDAHKVFACFDQPDLKGPFPVAVRAPVAWEVCGNGRVLGRDDHGDGSRTWRFHATPPLPTYLMAVAAGDFRVVESHHRGIRLGLYARRSLAPQLEEQAAELFEITRQGLDFFAEEFALAYPFDEYKQLFVPEFNMGAMENPGCVTFNEMFVFRSRATELQRARRAEVIVHEMAHVCGFGDVATMRWWGDLWLNETFATYMANKAMVAATVFTNAWVDFANTMKSAAARQDQLPSTHPISTPCADTNEVRQNFDGITYQKGAAVLKQLVAWVGDAAFTAGVREYFRRYRWGNASLREFLACIETASGRDLGAWSAEWLRTAGMNTLRPEIEVRDGRVGSLTIVQSAPPHLPTLRSHHVRVGLYRLEEDRLIRFRQVDAEVRGERTEVAELRGEQLADVTLINDEDLTFAKLRFDPVSMRTLLCHLGGLEDPLPRALCWAALWDMTRDAELPTRDFVDAVLHHARVEAEVTVLERLLSQALAAIDQFGDPANREAARAAMAGAAWERLSAAAPGGDVQLTWARAHIAAADSGADLERLERLLDGAELVPGLAVDNDLRWMIVGRLACLGRGAVARIEAQLAADDTDFGRRRAAACRAAQPDAAAKRAAFDLVVGGAELPLQMQYALMGGFGVGPFAVGGLIQWGEKQAELLRPCVDRWIEAVPQFWARRSSEEAESFTEFLYPRELVEPATLEAADAALAAIQAAADLSESTRRAASRPIVEGRDGTERAMRARAGDIAAKGR
ncbi:MAG: aminopeptidase N [Candidatus Dormibacteria bacterium]